MINMVNSVSTALIAARSQVKLAETAVSVFQVAKAKHDNSTMERAISYAVPAISESLSKSEDVTKALMEAQKAAKVETQKEFEEALKETHEKDTPTPNENMQANDDSTTTQDTTNDPAITDTQPAAPVRDNWGSQSDVDAQNSTNSISITSDNTTGKTVDISA